MVAKMSPKMKMFEKSGMDNDKGLKEGSKQDKALDKRQMAKMPAMKPPMKKGY
jgi:hypothetical protein